MFHGIYAINNFRKNIADNYLNGNEVGRYLFMIKKVKVFLSGLLAFF